MEKINLSFTVDKSVRNRLKELKSKSGLSLVSLLVVGVELLEKKYK